MEAEWPLGLLRTCHRGFFVLSTPIFFPLKDLLVEWLRRGLWDIVCFEIHRTISVLFFFLLPCIFFKPFLSDGLLALGLSACGASRHAKGLGDGDIVFTLAALRYHILLVHQCLFKATL